MKSILLVLVLVCSVLVGCTDNHQAELENLKLKVKFAAPVFHAVDQNNNTFSSDKLKGKVWLASYFFTTCETVCPILNAHTKRLQEEFGSAVTFVSITTDPETDTIARLKEYATAIGAKDTIWYMLRMPEQQMREVAERGFKLMKPETPEMHSTRYVLVDKDMNIRDYFDSEDSAEMNRLRTTLRVLIK